MPESPALGGRAVLHQQWHELAYFHWRYDPTEVQALLPKGLTVDTFDGSAWVGLIPFEMRNVRVGPTPPIPWLGNFHEINVRTYVYDQAGRRAVWFFSLDVPRLAIVGVARSIFSLPYCWAKTTHEVVDVRHTYTMKRRWPHASSTSVTRASIAFSVGEEIDSEDVTELDHFLCSRWALITKRRSRLLYGRVHHQPWPLQKVVAVDVKQNAMEAAGLTSPVGEPHALFSSRVDVSVEWFRRIQEEQR